MHEAMHACVRATGYEVQLGPQMPSLWLSFVLDRAFQTTSPKLGHDWDVRRLKFLNSAGPYHAAFV